MFHRQFKPPVNFIRLVRVQPVVKPAPLRVTRIQFFFSQFIRLSATPRFFGKAFQRTRPAAVCIVETIGMQAGKEIRDSRPRANELFVRQIFE